MRNKQRYSDEDCDEKLPVRFLFVFVCFHGAVRPQEIRYSEVRRLPASSFCFAIRSDC